MSAVEAIKPSDDALLADLQAAADQVPTELRETVLGLLAVTSSGLPLDRLVAAWGPARRKCAWGRVRRSASRTAQ
jgi:hypothetical protein